MQEDLVAGLMKKGFTRSDAVFLACAIRMGRASSKLRDEIGTFGLTQLDGAIVRLMGADVTGVDSTQHPSA